ncbi:helix-turn-helix transcriptional regulator [Hyphobacterium sp.]|jgi:predicted DNA-binding transcriptional regulator AlpA|uniref:helix-turn-helix transcriptional regulator n=1 Tax=Hyphobacterium sp. TaxID=2004662 RepID=UPI003BAB0A03
MAVFEFAIVATGLDPAADDFEDRFFDAGCNDATLIVTRGAIVLHFAREAGTLSEALESAIADVRAAGAVPERVEPDNLVSLSDIAQRAGLTRQAISNYASGKGPRAAGFPRPVARITSESPLWDWAEMAAWLAAKGVVSQEVLEAARVIETANRGFGRTEMAAE